MPIHAATDSPARLPGDSVAIDAGLPSGRRGIGGADDHRVVPL